VFELLLLSSSSLLSVSLSLMEFLLRALAAFDRIFFCFLVNRVS